MAVYTIHMIKNCLFWGG